jgi:hypothetical protein
MASPNTIIRIRDLHEVWPRDSVTETDVFLGEALLESAVVAVYEDSHTFGQFAVEKVQEVKE